MTVKYKHIRSAIIDNKPTPANLAVGEIAVNFTTKKLYTKDANNVVIELYSGDPLVAPWDINTAYKGGDRVCYRGEVWQVQGIVPNIPAGTPFDKATRWFKVHDNCGGYILPFPKAGTSQRITAGDPADTSLTLSGVDSQTAPLLIANGNDIIDKVGNLVIKTPGPYADNTAASAAGLTTGQQYYTATGDVKVVI
jgi:hypothetical protein